MPIVAVGKSPAPRHLMTALVLHVSTGHFTQRVPQCNYASQKNPVIFFTNPPQKFSQKQAENSASFWSQGNLSDSLECID